MQFVFLARCDSRTGADGLIGDSMAGGVNSALRSTKAGGRGAPRLVVAPPSDRERAFIGARRRSLRVRLLRKALLVGSLGTVAAMVLITIYNPFAAKFGALSFSALSLDGTKVTIAGRGSPDFGATGNLMRSMPRRRSRT